MDLKFQDDSFESVWVEISNKNSKNMICGSLYRHPNYDMTDFMMYMESTLKTIASEDKEIYICGDFNVDLLKLNDNENYHIFYNLLNSYGFLPLILHPTRVVDNQVPSIIDNIFSNNIIDEIESGNIYLTLSEHFSQFASVNRTKLESKSSVRFTRDFSKYSSDDFRCDIVSLNWNMNNTSSSTLFDDFYAKLNNCANSHAPLRKLTAKELSFKNKPWITRDLQKMIGIRNKLFARKKRQPDNEITKYLYNKFRNRVNRELTKNKKSYYTEYFEKYKNDIKKTWQGIKSIVNVKKSPNQCLSQLNVEDRILDDPKAIANHMNKFFVNVGPDLDKKIPKINHISANKFLKNRNQFNFSVTHIKNE